MLVEYHVESTEYPECAVAVCDRPAEYHISSDQTDCYAEGCTFYCAVCAAWAAANGCTITRSY